MTPEPDRLLAEHVVLRTRDIQALHAYIAGMEGRHVRYVPDDGPLDVELRHASLGRIDVGLHRASVRIAVESTRRRSDAFLVQFPLSGGIDLEVDGHEFSIQPGAGAVLSPGQHLRRIGKPGWTLVLRIPSWQVRAQAEARLGRASAGGLAFQPRIGAHAAELLNFGLLLVEAIDRGVAAPGSSVSAALEDGFVRLLLELQPHTHGSRLSRSDVSARSARVQRLSDYIDRHLDRKLTVEALARTAGCSVRSLQATFSELWGLSPIEFVQLRRLAAARKLLETPGETATVSQVAVTTGFPHFSRFAARYRARYGESPSETRRRVGLHGRRRKTH